MIAHADGAEHAALIVAGLVALGLYGWGWWRSPKASVLRLLAWAGGLTVLLVSVVPVVEGWAQRSFTGHMVQHLLMIVVAPPLLVWAAPVRTVRQLVPRSVRPSRTERRVGSWWRANGALAAAAGFIGVLYVTHLTGIYDLALRQRLVHDAEHVAYVGSATALWAAMRSPTRHAATTRIGAVFAVIGASALLGVVLLSASTPLIDTYAASLGVDEALTDQRAAASLMWVGGMATSLPLLIVAVWSWAATEERIARRAEAETSHRGATPG